METSCGFDSHYPHCQPKEKKMNKHNFVLRIVDGDTISLVTIHGDPENGYSVNNFMPYSEDENLPKFEINLEVEQ